VCTDIGGFVFGKLIGGKKFTKISPNKTYSGILGAFLFSISIGSFFYSYFDKYLSFKDGILFAVPFGILITM
jgi:phosphatidate cytidylyltransferase